jgi:hypothetical protein
MAIEVGDAIFKFLGDSTQLDTKFAEVGPKATAAFIPATQAAEGLGVAIQETGNKATIAGGKVEVAAKLSAHALREAKGEAGLLGEAFGIHLPRHVRTFVAEMPGVGAALSAAFSATAVLFLVEALVKASEKLSDFVGSALIYTKELKEQHSLLVQENDEIAKQSELYNKAAASLLALTDLRTPYEKLQDLFKAQTAELDRLAFKQGEYARTTAAEDQARARALQEQIKLTEAQIVTQALADKDKNNADHLKQLQQEIELRKKLAQVQVTNAEVMNGLSKENADEIRYQISLKALQALAGAETKFGKDSENKVRQLNASIEALQTEHALKTTENLQRQREELQKNLDEMQKTVQAAPPVDIITPKVVQNLMAGIGAARSLGIVLKQDLVQAYLAAKKAQEDFMQSGLKDGVAQTAIANNILKTKAALDAYGQTEDRWKARSHGMWNEFRTDTKEGATSMDQVKQLGVTAFDDLSKGMESAIQQAILSQASLSQALERATAQALASIASQALVKSMFYTAEGFAALVTDPSGAADYFIAAGEMAAVGAAAGIAAHAMAGGGGSSRPSTFQNNNGGSNTSQVGRGGTSMVGVQAMAEGGLVTRPTLILAGEAGREAVIPLDNPHAKQQMDEAGMGGGTHHHLHVNVQGMISPDNLAKVVEQINKRVNRGQLHLQASSSLRISKRSA